MLLAVTGGVVLGALVAAGGLVFVAIVSVKGKNASQAAEKSSEATAFQVTPNGGSSMADAVRRIEATIARVEERQMMTDREVRNLSDRINATFTPPDGTPITKG
jgi:hypothetical protein